MLFISGFICGILLELAFWIFVALEFDKRKK